MTNSVARILHITKVLQPIAKHENLGMWRHKVNEESNAKSKREEMTQRSFFRGSVRHTVSTLCSSFGAPRKDPRPQTSQGVGLAKWPSQRSSYPLIHGPSTLFGIIFSTPEWRAPNHAQCLRKDLLPLLPQSSESSRKAWLASRLGDRDHQK